MGKGIENWEAMRRLYDPLVCKRIEARKDGGRGTYARIAAIGDEYRLCLMRPPGLLFPDWVFDNQCFNL